MEENNHILGREIIKKTLVGVLLKFRVTTYSLNCVLRSSHVLKGLPLEGAQTFLTPAVAPHLSCFLSMLWALLCARTLLALLRRCSSLFCWIRASSFEMVQIPQMESLIPYRQEYKTRVFQEGKLWLREYLYAVKWYHSGNHCTYFATWLMGTLIFYLLWNNSQFVEELQEWKTS